jgi:predicted RNase H-like HicB family nuclease
MEAAPATVPDTPAEVAKPAAEEVRKYKINGKEKVIRAAEVDKYASIGLAADEKFVAAKQMLEEAKALASKKPIEALMAQGKTREEARRMLEDHLLELHAEDQMDPRERELRELRKRDAETKAEKEARQKAEEEAAVGKKAEAALLQLEHEIVSAAEKHGLPKDVQLMRSIAYEMQTALAHGVDLPAEKAAGIVLNQWKDNAKSFLGALSPETVKEVLGDKLFKSLIALSVADVKRAEAPFAKQQTQGKPLPTNRTPGEESENKKEIVDYGEYFRNRRRASIANR